MRNKRRLLVIPETGANKKCPNLTVALSTRYRDRPSWRIRLKEHSLPTQKKVSRNSDSPQAEFLYHQHQKIIPSGVYFFHKQKLSPQQVSLSLAAVIHPQPRLFLQISRSSSRVSLPHKVILTSLFSSRIILTIIFSCYSQRERRIQLFCSSSNPGFIFPSQRTSQNIACSYITTYAYASYNTISFILRTSLLDTYHALHTNNLYLSGKIQSNSHQIQSMKLLPQLNYGRVPKSQQRCLLS